MADARSLSEVDFSIRSIHDGVDIECRIVFDKSTSSQGEVKGAVLAHPYGPLGGSLDDPVLQMLAKRLVAMQFFVCMFNFRGSGQSGGKTSWTGNAEIQDFTSVVGLFVHYLLNLRVKDAVRANDQPCEIILAGYSYGSMICSRLPNPAAMLDSFYDANSSEPRQRILQKAAELSSNSSTSKPYLKGQVRWRFLLICPLLPPVTTALAMPLPKSSAGDAPFANLTEYHTLAVFGDGDVFASASRLVKWAQGLQQSEQSKFHFIKIDGAGHFWREPGATKALWDAISDWLKPT